MPNTAQDEWRVIESLLPAGWSERAREEKAFRRARYTQTPGEVLRLILFHAASGTGLRATVEQARAAGLASMSAVGLFKRLKTAGSWLRWISTQMCQSLGERPVLPEGLRPRAIDGTTIQGPASRGTDWRLHYTLNLLDSSCDWHELTDAHVGESLTRVPVRAGDVLLGDRAYLSAEGVRAVVGAGGHVLVRMRWTHPALVDARGRKVKALSLARKLRVGEVGDWPVHLSMKGSAPVRGRVVALKLPRPLAELAIRRMQRNASRKQKCLDRRSIEAAQYVMLFTTLSKKQLSAAKVLELYRFRWQIELAFKRHKQLLQLGQLPHKDPLAAQSWILAKLVLALLLETLYRNALAISPWGYKISEEAAA
jgi:hypothetical protein